MITFGCRRRRRCGWLEIQVIDEAARRCHNNIRFTTTAYEFLIRKKNVNYKS